MGQWPVTVALASGSGHVGGFSAELLDEVGGNYVGVAAGVSLAKANNLKI